ncbi:hypothetical protein GCM10018962_49550 [Dactylosporangium matsuzakiense]|uniref:Uncharacterized protein n=1 Tax=Dactylosporangium matsuzakiense TaxID=53360 RepID=A0A9W6KT30_9ACTN|nr:hypothetical protein GCM10017581_084730 [Dactylosporangium matsuzakiense]
MVANCTLYEPEIALIPLIDVICALRPWCLRVYRRSAPRGGELDFGRGAAVTSLCQAIGRFSGALPADRAPAGCRRGAAGCGAVAAARTAVALALLEACPPI